MLPAQLVVMISGTAITGEEVWKFAEATGAFVSQQDLSVQFQNPDAYLELDMGGFFVVHVRVPHS